VSPTSACGWGDWSAPQVERLKEVLVEVARELGRALPPPRGLPFHGLDHPAGELEPYTHLAAHGIFRKYESVLLLGAGLGAAARWCHAHFGCDVTGVESQPALAAAAQHLSQRARLAGHADFLAARFDRLPLRDRAFTHVWGVEVFSDVAEGDARLAELFRVVRLGGAVALQQSGEGDDWPRQACAALRSVGFVEARGERGERPPLNPAALRARPRLLQALTAGGALGEATAAALSRLWAAWPAEGGPLNRVFARRPS